MTWFEYFTAVFRGFKPDWERVRYAFDLYHCGITVTHARYLMDFESWGAR